MMYQLIREDKIKNILQNEWVTVVLSGILATFYIGYFFNNTGLHLAIFIKQLSNPSFLTNNYFYQKQFESIYLLKLLSYISIKLSIPINYMFLILYLVKNILLAGGAYKLAYALTKDRNVALISIFAIYYCNDQRIPLSFDISTSAFTLSSFAVATSFYALSYFIEKKYLISFIILGIQTNIHFIMSTQILLIILLIIVIQWRETPWRKVFYGIVTYCFLASAEIVNVVTMLFNNIMTENIDNQWYIEIIGYMRAPHHFIPSTWSFEQYARFAVYIIAGIYSYYNIKKNDTLFDGIKICLIILAICLVLLPFIYIYIPILLYQPFRLTIWVVVIMLIYIVGFLIKTFNGGIREGSIIRAIWAIIAFAVLNSPIILIMLFSMQMIHDFYCRREKINLIFIGLIGILMILLLFIDKMQYPIFSFWPDGYTFKNIYQVKEIYLTSLIIVIGSIKIYSAEAIKLRNVNKILFTMALIIIIMIVVNYCSNGKLAFTRVFNKRIVANLDGSLKELTVWINNNTRKKDIFIYPIYLLGREFMYYGERSILCDNDIVDFRKEKVKEWFNRLNMLSNGDLSKKWIEIIKKESYCYFNKILKMGYITLNKYDFIRIGSEYNCSYVITERGHEVDLFRVYYNDEFNVYQIK